MATVYFAVFDRREQEAGQVSEQTWEKAKLLPAKVTAPKSSGGIEDACILRLEAESVKEAQEAVEHFYSGLISSTPVIVTEAAFKES